MNYHARIVRDPRIIGGEPILKGTRVTLRTVLASLAEGATTAEILADFPTLSDEDVRSVVASRESLGIVCSRYLPESNAITWYLADGSALIPADRFARAQMLQWMFFEQYSHEPYIAVARFWMAFVSKEKLREKEHLIPEWHAKGNAALAVMEGHLKKNDWFAGGNYSLADIALYGYTHCAEDGGFDLKKYPAIGAWLKRVASTKGYVKMVPVIVS